MNSEMARIPHDQVPSDLFIELVQEIGNFSVALARMTGNDPATFQILGSGTCVRRGSHHGILTAHHVLHAQDRPVKLGVEGPDRIYFLGKSGHVPVQPQQALVEQPLGVPEGNGDFGPDLTFIPLPLDSSLRGTCSFWNLDQDPAEILGTFAKDRTCIVNAGYPAAKYVKTESPNAIHAAVTLQGGAGALMEGDIVQRGEWDYINSECDYSAFPNLLQSYKGMSGGGIWSALLAGSSHNLRVKRFGLVGVNFWQTPKENNKSHIRGHFVRSIYHRAWHP